MLVRVLVTLSASLTVLSACSEKVEVAPAPAPLPAAAPTPTTSETAAPSAPAAEAAAAPKVESSCGAVAAEQLENPKVVSVARPDGKVATHAGDAFAGAALVKVSDLLANPAGYAGKTVALEGDVSAMCTHERAWFAVAADDQSGRFVRVMTAPTFLVPAGSVGLTARTEGTVEVVEVAADHARHLAGEHQLGDPSAIKDNLQQVIVRARGAEFY